jgi:NSS family neurotransmitter:Na+ symporter
MVAILHREMEVPRFIAMSLIALLLYGAASLAITEDGLRQSIDGWLVPILIPCVLGITALFTGWRIPRPILRAEKYREPFLLFYGWFLLLRWVAPILCFALGILTLLRLTN